MRGDEGIAISLLHLLSAERLQGQRGLCKLESTTPTMALKYWISESARHVYTYNAKNLTLVFPWLPTYLDRKRTDMTAKNRQDRNR